MPRVTIHGTPGRWGCKVDGTMLWFKRGEVVDIPPAALARLEAGASEFTLAKGKVQTKGKAATVDAVLSKGPDKPDKARKGKSKPRG